MTTKPKMLSDPQNTVTLERTADETDGFALARLLLQPDLRHGYTASAYANHMLSSEMEKPNLMDFAGFVTSAADNAAGGDLRMASRLLASQALTLDSMFSEFARRAALNMGEYMDAAEKYARLALKAQSNCRATLESLGRLHQPREQTVRHVHVNDGGQAVIADEFHHHSGGQNVGSAEQSHAPTGAGISGPALPCSNAEGLSLPVTRSARAQEVPDARGDQPGGAEREP